MVNLPRYHLMREYGISDSDYDVLFESQGWACAICRRPRRDGERRFPIDHDHVTGEIRGILCDDCNVGIGRLKDSVRLLASAIVYLEDGISAAKTLETTRQRVRVRPDRHGREPRAPIVGLD